MSKISRFSWDAPVWLTIEGLAVVGLAIALYRKDEEYLTKDSVLLLVALGAIGAVVAMIGIVKGVKNGWEREPRR